MEYECSWIGQGERLVDSRRKNGASKKEDNKYIPLETMIEMGLIKLVQVLQYVSWNRITRCAMLYYDMIWRATMHQCTIWYALKDYDMICCALPSNISNLCDQFCHMPCCAMPRIVVDKHRFPFIFWCHTSSPTYCPHPPNTPLIILSSHHTAMWHTHSSSQCWTRPQTPNYFWNSRYDKAIQ